MLPKFYVCMLLVGTLFISCNKKEFLDASPDTAMVVPQTLTDYQAMMDNDFIMNGSTSVGLTPAMGEMAADNYFVSDLDYNTRFKPVYQNIYVWAPEIFAADDIVYDWDFPYRAVLYANIVLDGIQKLKPGTYDQQDYNNVKGTAHFHRAHMFYQLAQVFAPHYIKTTAASKDGIPLRKTPHADEDIVRADLQTTYDFILDELHQALALLPKESLYKTRPSHQAVFGLMARVHQTMQHYDSAGYYSGKYLEISNELMDYNTISTAGTFAFKRYNAEVIFSSNMENAEVTPIRAGRNQVDTNLYRSYNTNDLRKALFFKIAGGVLTFTGSYDGGSTMFSGIATNEIYLIRAEAAARAGNSIAAMKDLNILLQKRFKTGTFVPLEASNGNLALQLVLEERRKELCFRGLRWTDLRRLNAEGHNITLTRKVNGQLYTLLPGDKKYTFPIPIQVLAFNPGMPQNPR